MAVFITIIIFRMLRDKHRWERDWHGFPWVSLWAHEIWEGRAHKSLSSYQQINSTSSATGQHVHGKNKTHAHTDIPLKLKIGFCQVKNIVCFTIREGCERENELTWELRGWARWGKSSSRRPSQLTVWRMSRKGCLERQRSFFLLSLFSHWCDKVGLGWADCTLASNDVNRENRKLHPMPYKIFFNSWDLLIRIIRVALQQFHFSFCIRVKWWLSTIRGT